MVIALGVVNQSTTFILPGLIILWYTDGLTFKQYARSTHWSLLFIKYRLCHAQKQPWHRSTPSDMVGRSGKIGRNVAHPRARRTSFKVKGQRSRWPVLRLDNKNIPLPFSWPLTLLSHCITRYTCEVKTDARTSLWFCFLVGEYQLHSLVVAVHWPTQQFGFRKLVL